MKEQTSTETRCSKKKTFMQTQYPKTFKYSLTYSTHKIKNKNMSSPKTHRAKAMRASWASPTTTSWDLPEHPEEVALLTTPHRFQLVTRGITGDPGRSYTPLLPSCFKNLKGGWFSGIYPKAKETKGLSGKNNLHCTTLFSYLTLDHRIS